MHQTTLSDDPDDHDTASTTTTTITADRESSSNASANLNLASPDQRGGEGSCPWCLASTDTFEHHDDGTVGCGYCHAAIPIGMEWYERGEKIVI